MPSLPYLALRYTAWLIGLRILYGLLVAYAGLPNTMATGVILATAPAVDIAMQAIRRADRPLAIRDWGVIWALLVSIFAVLQFILPAIVLSFMREVMADVANLQTTVLILISTGAMMALFLFIGARTVKR